MENYLLNYWRKDLKKNTFMFRKTERLLFSKYDFGSD